MSYARSGAHKAYTSSRKAKMTSPSCNCSFTSARASCTAKQNKKLHQGVALFSTLALSDHTPRPILVLPMVRGRLRTDTPDERQQTTEGLHFEQLAQHGTPEHVVIGTNAVIRKNGGAGVEIGHRSDCMPHAICACTGRHGELKWRTHLLNLRDVL